MLFQDATKGKFRILGNSGLASMTWPQQGGDGQEETATSLLMVPTENWPKRLERL